MAEKKGGRIDYEKYKYLEHTKLRGTVNPAENGVQIQIFEVS